ncbi:FkbM family methyltransferase [Neoroseomonas soli]|uniref:FkbM family methyltransferase n=1 Tax=Neoroseomonas soli TaxID=1081025 RepID=A0A9X9X0V4_9PROT|nr:FkbM family methyltransferase [Neoroseomonas soli]MBR0673033.1 FkbM family methyltransferase [Neoroseomonas soli]
MSEELRRSMDGLARRMDDVRAAVLFQAMGPERIHSFAAFDTLVRMHLPFAATDYVQRYILLSGSFYESRQLAEVRPLIPPGAVVVDAGGNIGNHAVFFAMVCRAAEVISFEPLKTIFPILERNVALNGLTNVRCINAALGAGTGGAALSYFQAANLAASGFDLGAGTDYPMTSIDALGLQRLDFLKIDVEGNHLPVLEGARETLARLRPPVWIELRPRLGEFATGDAAMRAQGYRLEKSMSPADHLYLPA